MILVFGCSSNLSLSSHRWTKFGQASKACVIHYSCIQLYIHSSEIDPLSNRLSGRCSLYICDFFNSNFRYTCYTFRILDLTLVIDTLHFSSNSDSKKNVPKPSSLTKPFLSKNKPLGTLYKNFWEAKLSYTRLKPGIYCTFLQSMKLLAWQS